MADNSGKAAGKRRGKGRPFKPGQSGNPGGRKPLPPEYKEAMETLEPRAWEALDEILADDRHPRREQAAEYVIDRVRGRPKTTSELSGPGGGPIPIAGDDRKTTEELRRELAALEALEATEAERRAAEVAAREEESAQAEEGAVSGGEPADDE